MDEKLNGAIEVLLERLRDKEREVIEAKKMINSLRQMSGESPLFSDAELQQGNNPTRRDLFYGKPLSTACREYLEFRKQACDAEEILNALEDGGFDFEGLGWKEKDWLRSLSISLAKNSGIFHRLPNGSFGLLAWYPEVKKPKAATKNEQEQNIEESKKKVENGAVQEKPLTAVTVRG